MDSRRPPYQPPLWDPQTGFPVDYGRGAQQQPFAQAQRSTGYPVAPSIPAGSGAMSSLSYLSHTRYQFDNTLLREALHRTQSDSDDQHKIKTFAKSTALILLCYGLGNRTIVTPLGTGVIVQNIRVITAKHVLSSAFALAGGANFYVAKGYYGQVKNCTLYKVREYKFHPSEDIAVLTVNGKFSDTVEIKYDATLEGEYWVTHHAGAMPTQISTGEFATGVAGAHLLDLDLFINAGPIASGAGIFDHARFSCVGIVVRRSKGLGRISRKLLSFHKVKKWLKDELGKAEPLPSLQHVAPLHVKLGSFIDCRMYTERLYGDALETINRRKILSEHIPEFKKFIDSLKSHLTSGSAIEIPPLLLLKPPCFDQPHQSHHGYGGRSDKTWLHQKIKGNILFALGVLIEDLMYLYLHVVQADYHDNLLDDAYSDVTKFNIAFDFGFNIAADLQRSINPQRGEVRAYDYTFAMYDGDKPGMEQKPEKFHFYPVSRDDQDQRNLQKLANLQVVNIKKLFDYLLIQDPNGLLILKEIRHAPPGWQDWCVNDLSSGVIAALSAQVGSAIEEGDMLQVNALKYIVRRYERRDGLYADYYD